MTKLVITNQTEITLIIKIILKLTKQRSKRRPPVFLSPFLPLNSNEGKKIPLGGEEEREREIEKLSIHRRGGSLIVENDVCRACNGANR